MRDLWLMAGVAVLLAASGAGAGENKKPEELTAVTLRAVGLCYPERIEEFKTALAAQPRVTLKDLNYERAEVVVEFNPKNFSVEQIRHLLGSKGMSVKVPSPKPYAELERTQIPIQLLDCKICCQGTSNVLNRVEGVEHVTVSQTEVMAVFDGAKTNRDALIKALRQAQVGVREPEKKDEKKS